MVSLYGMWHRHTMAPDIGKICSQICYGYIVFNVPCLGMYVHVCEMVLDTCIDRWGVEGSYHRVLKLLYVDVHRKSK